MAEHNTQIANPVSLQEPKMSISRGKEIMCEDLLLKADEFGDLIPGLGRELTMQCLIHRSRSEYRTISLINKSFMSVIRNEELYRLRLNAGNVEPWIYFMADVGEWKAYDPKRRRFMNLPRLTSTSRSFEVECLAIGFELLVFPTKCSKMVNRYNAVSNTWKKEASGMITPRSLFGATSKGEIAIFAGGRDSGYEVLSSVELYNSRFGKWTQLPNMKRARMKCSCVFLGGMLYVIGGLGENNETLTSADVYDFEKKIWCEIPGMWHNRTTEQRVRARSSPLVAVLNGQLYAADNVANEVLSYDMNNNAWSSIGKFPDHAPLSGLVSFGGCGDRLILVSRKTKDRYDFELHACVPLQDQLQWELLARMRGVSFAVMEC